MRNKIYTVSVFYDMTEDNGFGWPELVCLETKGFYTDKDAAFNSVINNALDIWEHCYNYALIEEVEEGLYQPAGSGHRWFFHYDLYKGIYEQIEEPEYLAHLAGFSMG